MTKMISITDKTNDNAANIANAQGAQGISGEIECNEQLDQGFLQDLAEFFAESIYADAFEAEISCKHSAKVCAEYRRTYKLAVLSKLENGCLFYHSIEQIMTSTGKIVELDGKLFIVKSVFTGGNRDMKKAIFNLAAKKAAQAMGLY